MYFFSSRPNSSISVNSIVAIVIPLREREIVHPSVIMTKEEYLKCLGLVSIESLKSQPEVKRVERRRRTTANPKYNTNGFVELRQLVNAFCF